MTKERLHVGVMFGGRSGEHEVSLVSARAVLGALDPERYDITEIGITHEGVWLAGEGVYESFLAGMTDHLTPVTVLPDPTRPGLYALERGQAEEHFEQQADIDVFFPVLHGTFGEDGTIQGLFEMAGVAYVGAGVLGSSVGMDKGLFKSVMRAHDVPVVESEVVLRSELEVNRDAVMEKAETVAKYPLFVKPANLGSSVGISKCHNRSDLLEGLMELHATIAEF